MSTGDPSEMGKPRQTTAEGPLDSTADGRASQDHLRMIINARQSLAEKRAVITPTFSGIPQPNRQITKRCSLNPVCDCLCLVDG